MYQEALLSAAAAARRKADLTLSRPGASLLHAALAGAYVGIGIVFIFSLGAPLAAHGSPFIPALMGAAFGIALCLVIFAGSDLFTGNAFLMPVGIMSRNLTWPHLGAVFVGSYVGNLIGSVALAWLVAGSGLFAAEPQAAFVLKTAAKKMHLPFDQAFLRGVLCNWLVCLAVWLSFRMKSETGKLIMIGWCLFAFIGAGFEHSVANMTLLSLANFLPHGPEISWAGMVNNLIPVTLGNIAAGAGLVALTYSFISPLPHPARRPAPAGDGSEADGNTRKAALPSSGAA